MGENTLATAVVLAAWEQRWDRLIPIAADLREGSRNAGGAARHESREILTDISRRVPRFDLASPYFDKGRRKDRWRLTEGGVGIETVSHARLDALCRFEGCARYG